MATVVIVLPPGQAAGERKKALRRITARLRAAGETGPDPTFPGTTDPDLLRFFHLDPASTEPSALATALAELPGVDGAYVKPADEAP